MRYLKTFESFSPINEEEEFFDAIKRGIEKVKKFLYGDVIEDNLDSIVSSYLRKNNITIKDDAAGEKAADEIRKTIEQIRSETDISTKNELLKSIIGDFDNKDTKIQLNQMRVPFNKIRYELDCMTPEEKEEFDSRKQSSSNLIRYI